MQALIFLIPLFFIFIIFVGAVVINLDKNRVHTYFENRGDSIISIHWRLFGKGWVSEASKEGGGNRIYEVEYKDIYGNLKHAWCKTAMLSGVFLTEEKITSEAENKGRPLTAEEKVTMLEEEVRRLRSEKKQDTAKQRTAKTTRPRPQICGVRYLRIDNDE